MNNFFNIHKLLTFINLFNNTKIPKYNKKKICVTKYLFIL